MHSEKVSSYLPWLYDGCLETDELTKVEDEILDLFENYSQEFQDGQFITTAPIEAVEQREKSLGIIANPSIENLEFRRDRLLNRYAMSPPFTLRFLGQKLDTIMGVGTWALNIDYNNRILYVESSAFNQIWYEELEFTINYLKPCNMVFTNVPLIAQNMLISEEVLYNIITWNYRMSNWKLGQKSFSSMSEGGIIKMPGSESLKNLLLGSTADFIASYVKKAVINDTHVIDNFSRKEALNNEVLLEYTVNSEMTDTILNIKLLNENNEVLSESNVYVPVTQTVMNKHTLKVMEG